jgi:DUSP27; dual specificity phosphatase 27 (putative)
MKLNANMQCTISFYLYLHLIIKRLKVKGVSMTNTEKELAQNAKREYARKWRAENRDKVKAANERYWLRRAVKTMAAADEPEKEVF